MSRKIRIGTRQSALAVEQTRLVAEALKTAHPDLEVEFVMKMTKGDKILNKPLQEFGGKGVFVMEFEQALLDGEIDLAVHSAKDLPMELADGLGVVAIPRREDPRDVLVIRKGTILEGRKEVLVGTSSLRRQLQIGMLGQKLWPGSAVRCENLRGNVQTRLGKLAAGEYDAIILAAAGLKRLGLVGALDVQEFCADVLGTEGAEAHFEYEYFECDTFIPAGGQGILAVEGRLEDPITQVCAAITDREATICLRLERHVLRLLDAGCHEPIGIYSRIGKIPLSASGITLTEEKIELFGINQRNGETKQIHMFGDADDCHALAIAASKGLM